MRDLDQRATEQLDRLSRQNTGAGTVESWDDVIEQLGEFYHNGGLQPGTSTGWPAVDELFTVAPHQWTLITGAPGMGKSEWLDALAVNLVETGEWVFAMYSPENFPVAIHVIKLLEKRARKPFNRGPRERVSKDELERHVRWVRERFTWIVPETATLMNVVRTATRLGRRPGKKLGIVVDPWNMLDHHEPTVRLPGMTETEYISTVLSELNRVLRSSEGADVHVFLVAHPTKLYRGNDGKYPVPTGYDIAGSAHFFNKADNILVVQRDKANGGQYVELHAQKIRFKHIGHFGSTTLAYDFVTGRYFVPLVSIPGDTYADPESGCEPPVSVEVVT